MRKLFPLIAVFILVFSKTAYSAADGAKSACLISVLTGEVIFEKNADERLPMASTTKIMTALTALENSSMNEIVEISKNAEGQEGSSAYIRAGNKMYMEDLLYGLMLNSGNDAAVAIAEHIAGSEAAFAEMMNSRARKMGADSTSFVNPNGLDAENHFTTARDLALIAREAMRNEDFAKIVSTKEILKHPIDFDEDLWYINHNRLLRSYEGCIGIKTGYTKTAGRCLVSAASRDGMTFIAVTLNDRNDWADHKEMLDYAFGKYYPKEIITKGERLKTAYVNGATYSFFAADSFIIPYREGDMLPIDIKIYTAKNVSPVNAGEKIGYADIMYGGEKIGSVDIISESDIYSEDKLTFKNSFSDVVLRVLKLLSV